MAGAFKRQIGGTTFRRSIKVMLKQERSKPMRTALSIAGSDSSGGAGIQADIKTMSANGVYAMTAVTALTAQNTTGVTDILDSTPAFLSAQLDAVFTDIFPDAVKIGMVSSAELISVIAQKLRQYEARHIVVDPVMVATSGSRLLREDAVEARKISEQYGCAVLCKGGHDLNDANDLLWKDGAGYWFNGCRINNPNTHGTGCTLSSAIAANLAKGMALEDAVRRAKEYISGALAAMLDLGHGRGPMNHLFDLKSAYMKEAE